MGVEMLLQRAFYDWWFFMGATLRQGRATHRTGVGAAGWAKVVKNPSFPAHPFFSPDRRFQVQLRHATAVVYDDDASYDVRGCALRLMQDGKPLLDLLMNTGETAVFWDLPSFGHFAFTDPVELGRRYFCRDPFLRDGLARAQRRAPDSFSDLRYYSKMAYRWKGTDGTVRLARFRVIPFDRRPESGMPTPADRARPWKLSRSRGENRARNYLRDEFAERVGSKGVSYWLQVQWLDQPADLDDKKFFHGDAANSAFPWERPWEDLVHVRLTHALKPKRTERLRFNVGNHPDSLDWPKPRHPKDPNTIPWLRESVYPWSQRAREMFQLTEPSKLRRVTGRLVHDRGDKAPIGHMRVEVWDRDAFGGDLLGHDITDQFGKFDIEVQRANAGAFDKPDLELRFVDVVWSADLQAPAPRDSRVVHTVRGPEDFEDPHWDAGTVELMWWEYMDETLARVVNHRLGPHPERWTKGYLNKKLIEGVPFIEAHLRNLEEPLLSIEEMQSRFPASPTMEMEAQDPGSSRADAYVADRLLNGFNAKRLLYRNDDGTFSIKVGWDRYELDGFGQTLPNVVATFEPRGDDMALVGIRTQLRKDGATKVSGPDDLQDWRSFAPGDDAWDQAKRVLRVADFADGEFDAHLTDCHVNMEQYSIAAHRTLFRNPVRDLIFPHLREVSLINFQGTLLIIGPAGIMSTNTPLTADAVAQRVVDRMATLDWYGFAPREPLYANNRFAHAQKLMWEVIGEWVEVFFQKNLAGIREHWWEVKQFSNTLVAHSIAYQAVDTSGLYDTNEVEKPSGGPDRVEVDGALRVVRPITHRDRPNLADLENLKQVCRYILLHCTLLHTQANDNQLIASGESRFSSFALRGTGMGPESDDNIAQFPKLASQWLFINNQLVRNGYGYLVKNEDGDVAEGFRTRLEAKRAAFQAQGYDIDSIRARINI